jgi:hypothetical protein
MAPSLHLPRGNPLPSNLGAARTGRFPHEREETMASNPDQTQTITATYFPDVQQLSFDPPPPFTSNQPITLFIFNLQLGEGIPGTVQFNPDQPVIWATSPPHRGFTVTPVSPQQVSISDENSNHWNPEGFRFQFSFSVIYDDEAPQTVDPTIINAQIPSMFHGHEEDHGAEGAPAGHAV